MKENYVSHRLLDLFAIIVAGSLAHWVRFDSLLMGELYLFPLLFFALFVYLCLTTAGVYERALSVDKAQPWLLVARSVVLAAVFSSTCLYLTKTAELYSRIWFVLMVLFSLCLTVLYRYLLQRLEDTAVQPKNIVLLGKNEYINKIIEKAGQPSSKINVCGVFNDGDISSADGRVADSIEFIENQRREANPDSIISEVWIAQDVYSISDEIELQELFADAAVELVFVPVIPAHIRTDTSIEFVQGIPTINSELAYPQRRKHILKLLEDQLIAWPALVFLSPLFAIVAVLIKLDSPGSVFYTQKRYGIAGQEFNIWKFRTMHDNGGDGKFEQTSRGDGRVTRVGKWLRKFSLDELPQLFNVILGEMSLVGPRPHAAVHNEQNRKLINGYMMRHKIKPGITGLAQVRGLRGATNSVEDMEKRVSADLEYIREWDISLDIKIMIQTIAALLDQQNAY